MESCYNSGCLTAEHSLLIITLHLSLKKEFFIITADEETESQKGE